MACAASGIYAKPPVHAEKNDLEKERNWFLAMMAGATKIETVEDLECMGPLLPLLRNLILGSLCQEGFRSNMKGHVLIPPEVFVWYFLL